MRFALLLLAMQFCAAPVCRAEERKHAAFVGSFVKIDEVTCLDERRVEPGTKYPGHLFFDNADGSENLLVCHHRQFELTYRIEQVLAGKIRLGDRVKFFAIEQTRIPEVALRRFALIAIDQEENERWQLADWNEAYSTASGHFAQCGCAITLRRYDQADLIANDACVPFDFKPAVRYSLVDSSTERVDSYRRTPAFAIRGDFAICRRGVDAVHIVNAWKDRDEKDK